MQDSALLAAQVAVMMAEADDGERQNADCCPTMGQILANEFLLLYLYGRFNKEHKIIAMKDQQSAIFKNTCSRSVSGRRPALIVNI